MITSRIKERYRKFRKSRISQGDLLRDVKFVLKGGLFGENKNEIALKYAVVMSQECDIDLDFKARQNKKNNDKYLPTILVCPAYQAQEFFNGTHIKGWVMTPKTGGEPDKIKKNDQLSRYHYLEGNDDLSVPELVIDFKHFFTIPRSLMYRYRKTGYIATVNELFREELAQRFSFYLSRFALPEIKAPASRIAVVNSTATN